METDCPPFFHGPRSAAKAGHGWKCGLVRPRFLSAQSFYRLERLADFRIVRMEFGGNSELRLGLVKVARAGMDQPQILVQ